jgi:hypothetical protein
MPFGSIVGEVCVCYSSTLYLIMGFPVSHRDRLILATNSVIYFLVNTLFLRLSDGTCRGFLFFFFLLGLS